MPFWLDIAAFALKALLIVAAVGGLVFVVTLLTRGEKEDSSEIKIDSLNERYDAQRARLNVELLSKKERKALAKASKKAAKSVAAQPAPPAVPAAKAETKSEASPVPVEESWLTGSLDFGYRWHTGVGGSFDTYRTPHRPSIRSHRGVDVSAEIMALTPSPFSKMSTLGQLSGSGGTATTRMVSPA